MGFRLRPANRCLDGLQCRWKFAPNPMKPTPRSLCAFLLPTFAAFAVLVGDAAGAVLVRGPYLQVATPDSMTIRWRTDEPVASVVRYGADPDFLNLIDGDLALTTEHEVKLFGLTPETLYYYSVGSLTEDLVEGPEYLFKTAPRPGTARPTRVWIVGDCGTANTGAGNQVGVRDAYYDLAGSRHTDVWLALGDNAYYSGYDHEYQENFFDVYSQLLRRTPIWSTIGNHETYSGAGNGRFPYLDIFTFPAAGEAGGVSSGTEKFYSFNHANIHFVCLDSMTMPRTSAGEMARWLEADLAANTNDWIIAFFHHPPYTKGSHDSDGEIEHIQMREALMPILEAHGADLVLGGHSHNYERSKLMRGHFGYSWELEPSMVLDGGSGRPGHTGPYVKPVTGPRANQGTVYCVAGSSGWATFAVGSHPIMYYDAVSMGSLVLDIEGNRLDAMFVRETGAIDDRFSIVKGDPEPFRFSAFRMENGATVARWQSIPGRSYQVERTPGLEVPDWQPIGGPVIATGSTTSWNHPAPAGASRGFYRVIESIP